MLVLENTIQSFTHPFLRVSTIGYIGKEPPLTEKWSTKAHIPSTNFLKSPSKPIYQGISRNAKHRNRNRERLKFNFFVPVFLPSRKPLGISQETEGHQILMKIEGVVVIASYQPDRTEIQAQNGDFLSAKWSTWNTLCSMASSSSSQLSKPDITVAS